MVRRPWRLAATLLVYIWLLTVGDPSRPLPHTHAQTPPPASEPMQLPPVEVRAQPEASIPLARRTSAFATVVDTTEATAQVDSVADVLAESAGVQVRRFGGLGAFSTVSIRGSSPNQVEVYLDNVLLNSANAGLVDLGLLPLDNVERIEIYRGFAPLQLGAGNIGGAIQLRTRQVAGTTTNSASASYGSFDTRKVTLYRSQHFDTLGYLLLFNYTGSEGDFQFFDDNGTRFNPADDEVTTRRNNDFNAFNVNAKGETTLAGWALTLSNDFFTKDQGVPGQSSNQSEHSRLDVTRNVTTLQGEKKGVPWQNSDLTLQLSHTWQREHFTDPDGTIGLGIQDEVNRSHTINGSGVLTLYLDKWHQIVGVLLDARYEALRTVDRLPRQRGMSEEEGPLQQRVALIAAVQDELLLVNERLSIRPLLRYEFVASDFGAQPSFGDVPLNIPQDKQQNLFSPSVGVKYRLLSFLDLKGNVGRFQRVPTLFELFGDRGTTLGNPELKSESSFNWDVGFIVELSRYGFMDRAFLEYAYFSNTAEDLIVFVQNSQTTAQARNVGAAEITGHEVNWSVTAVGHVRLFGNYTYQDARDTSQTFSRGNGLPGRPRHEWHQGVELFAGFGKLVYEFDYIAGNFLDRANAFEVDSRLLHNVSLTALPFGQRLKLTFEVKNITDNQIEDFRGFPLPGRSFFGTVEGRF